MKKFNFLMPPQNFPYLLPLLLFVLFAGCEVEAVLESENPSENFAAKAIVDKRKTNTFTGPAEPFGHGVVKAFVEMNHNGSPEAIGVSISEKVLDTLPEEHRILTLKLPKKMQGLAFDHIDLDWNPHGHEPFFYELPHFDVHFYMISEEEKATIVPLQESDLIFPDEEYRPEGYFLPANDIVPNMGMHWLSSDAPEIHGETFTHTFIYGSYQKNFIFMEPMITLDYLMNQADGTDFPIAQPAEFQKKDYYYPTSYSIDYDSKKKEYTITLDQMIWRE